MIYEKNLKARLGAKIYLFLYSLMKFQNGLLKTSYTPFSKKTKITPLAPGSLTVRLVCSCWKFCLNVICVLNSAGPFKS